MPALGCAIASVLVFAAQSHAAIQSFGSELTAPADVVEARQADTVYWQTTFADARSPLAPAAGQITSFRIKGRANSDKLTGVGPAGGERDFHLQALRPLADGTFQVLRTSQNFSLPPITADTQAITAYAPENFCVDPGDVVAFNTNGGWDGIVGGTGPYANGTPLQLFSSVPGAVTSQFTGHNLTNDGAIITAGPPLANHELLLQMTLATGPDATALCPGGTAGADVTAPASPTLTATSPGSPADNNSPRIQGAAEADSTVRLYTGASCSGAIAATGSAADFASPGLTAAVADNSSTTYRATATDQAGNTSACSSSSITYAEESIAPPSPMPQPQPPLPPPPLPTLDRTPPAAILSGRRSQKLGRAVSVSIACPAEACLADVTGAVRVPKIGATRGKRYTLKPVGGVLVAGRTATLRPQLSQTARRAIRRALRHGRTITANLEITVADTNGNTQTLARQVKLRL